MKYDYGELLRHPNWQRKRLEAMQRDNFTCQCCESKEKTLNVHHQYYKRGRLPWAYPMACFITLCEDCHLKDHRNKLLADLMVKYIKDADFRNKVDRLWRKAG